MKRYLPVREGELARLISRAASTIIVDYTTRLQMEVTRGCVEEILQEGNRVVLEQGIMSLTGQEIVEAGLADRLGNCLDYLLNIMVVEPVHGDQGWEMARLEGEDRESMLFTLLPRQDEKGVSCIVCEGLGWTTKIFESSKIYENMKCENPGFFFIFHRMSKYICQTVHCSTVLVYGLEYSSV